MVTRYVIEYDSKQSNHPNIEFIFQARERCAWNIDL